MNCKTTKIFLIPAILFAVFFAFGNEARADTYYATPADNLASKVSALRAGDTLILRNGIYYQSLDVTVSGTQTSPITIKAENDGKAIVDGQGATGGVCKIYQKSWITMEGIQCKNGGASGTTDVIAIWNSSNIILRKMSAHNDSSSYYGPLFGISSASNLLIEDSIATGSGRNLFNISSSNYVTMRRNFGKWINSGMWCGGGMNGIQIYGTSNSVFENNIFDASILSGDYCSQAVDIWANYYNNEADNNEIYGNIGINMKGYAFDEVTDCYILYNNDWRHNITIGGKYSVRYGGGQTGNFQNFTIINPEIRGFYHFRRTPTEGGCPTYPNNEAGWTNNAVFKNSVIVGNGGNVGIEKMFGSGVGTLTHSCNDLYNNGTDYVNTKVGTAEININPEYATSVYGKGAYLMVPPALKGKGEDGADIGAEVLYLYQDGALTNVPLWPWPMEDRIFKETKDILGTGISVTWEVNGGLWKTLDGVYSGGDTVPPAAPTGLTVQ